MTWIVLIGSTLIAFRMRMTIENSGEILVLSSVFRILNFIFLKM